MVNTVWVNVGRGRNLHPLADHIIKLNFLPKNEIMTFQHFDFHFSKCLNKH